MSESSEGSPRGSPSFLRMRRKSPRPDKKKSPRPHIMTHQRKSSKDSGVSTRLADSTPHLLQVTSPRHKRVDSVAVSARRERSASVGGMVRSQSEGALPKPWGSTSPKISRKSHAHKLLKAAAKGNLAKVAHLLTQGAGVNVQEKTSGMTALHEAARHGREVVVKFLLDSQASVSSRSFTSEQTPLHLGSANGHELVCRFLVEASAQINAKDIHGCTPLHAATAGGYSDVVGFLLESRANLEASCRLKEDAVSGMTPLLVALRADHAPCVQLLLEQKASVEAANSAGKGARAYANGASEECQRLVAQVVRKKRFAGAKSRRRSCPVELPVAADRSDASGAGGGTGAAKLPKAQRTRAATEVAKCDEAKVAMWSVHKVCALFRGFGAMEGECAALLESQVDGKTLLVLKESGKAP